MIDSCDAREELIARLQRDDAADERRDDDGERNRVDADASSSGESSPARTSPDRRTRAPMSRRKYAAARCRETASIQERVTRRKNLIVRAGRPGTSRSPETSGSVGDHVRTRASRMRPMNRKDGAGNPGREVGRDDSFAADRPRELDHQEKDHRGGKAHADAVRRRRRAACSWQAARRTAR